MMPVSGVERTLHKAQETVSTFLAQYGGELPAARISLEPDLEAGTLATHRYPGMVVIGAPSVPESVIAHELVHIAQGTLE